MIDWLKLTTEQKKAVIDEAEQLSGIAAKAIEKDWWVTLTLKALFQSAYQDYMLFKGGTSLSKGWKLIARFSEDIDIALSPTAFGMEYLDNPPSKYVNTLKRKGCEFTSNELKKELEKQFKEIGLPDGIITIEAAPVPDNRPDTDPQTLLIKYPSLYEANEYISDEVKIEVSVRSAMFPFTSVLVQTLLNEINPNVIYAETPFPVNAVEPRKTFLEKTFLLHEEFGKDDKAKIRTLRMSRHLYDLHKMMNTQVGTEALADPELYNHLIKHRESYMRISWVNYGSLKRDTISFIPIDEVTEEYHKDYNTMLEQMIYEESPASFDDMIESLKQLQEKFRHK